MRIRTLAIAGLALALTGCGEPEHVLGSTWTGPKDTPGGREFTPERAIAAQLSGWAVLGCQAGADLKAKRCVLLGEAPKGTGLGEGALRLRSGLTTEHVVGPGTPRPGGWAIVPITFCPNGDDACPTRMRPERDAFIEDVHRVLRLRATSGCTAALEAAAKLDQPALLSEIRGGCGG